MLKYKHPRPFLIQIEIYILFFSSVWNIANSCQDIYEFECANKLCISSRQRCDGFNDCSDFSDELDCDVYHCQEPFWYRCNNQHCVSKSFLCDGENDCFDFSDEQNCTSSASKNPSTSVANTCSAGEWQCADHLCIAEDWVCNGVKDCLDGSDETIGCTKRDHCDGFKCKNGHCIPNAWKCDGDNDCFDGSDELSCHSIITKPSECNIEAGMVYCNKTCILLKDFCIGSAQCPDITNKTLLCSRNTYTCNDLKCAYKCLQSPLGAKCLCPDGFRLENNVNCTDIDECRIYGICDQKCLNTRGSYNCYCDKSYELQSDKKTCKVKDGQPIMVFSSKTEVRGYFLHSNLYFPVAKDLKQVIGVAFDGKYFYWTEIYSNHESIVKATEDGLQRDVIVNSGLGSPEDLAVDWVTGNIYFTDYEMQHIGICTNDGKYCTVIMNRDINKPRSIVLDPEAGEMYWSDWGKHPEIARSSMDGSNDISFVANDIGWPNGLALDKPNNRLYWADANSKRLESINLDGTGRRIILEGIVKHPFALDVFENTIYWSDWASHSIESCDKFTGKNHTILIKQKHDYIYGIHVYHSALHYSRAKKPCVLSYCSHICVLNRNTYSCACPKNMDLGADRHTCKATIKDQEMIIGTSDSLIKIQLEELGKHTFSVLPTKVSLNITALAFSTTERLVFISDEISRSILSMNLLTESISHLFDENSIGHITAMDFDDFASNLYWCDSKKGNIEVYNIKTKFGKILVSDLIDEPPTALALVPSEGYMFVAFEMRSKQASHIDRLSMDGKFRVHIVERSLMGPLYLTYDSSVSRILFSDVSTGNIEYTSVEGDDRHAFQTLQMSPSAIVALEKTVYWINQNNQKVYFAPSLNDGNSVKSFSIDASVTSKFLHLISLTPKNIQTHPCQKDNGGCSHLCLVSLSLFVCDCPLGMKLQDDKKTCIKPRDCDLNEYNCKTSDMCVPKSMVCNAHKDCTFGEDEMNCGPATKCPIGFFQCKNKECIRKSYVCDSSYHCKDRSDEENCSYLNKPDCTEGYFKCSNGACVEEHLRCNGFPDCKDASDEIKCNSTTCNSNQFKCFTGLCVPKSWECDQHRDCPDGSDEHNGCINKKCDSTKFQCNNGLCIDDILKCNYVDDCGDNSDENGCSIETHESVCGFNEFHCYMDKSLCLPLQARCNGTSECPQHEDEKGCQNCELDQFECSNKQCILNEWLCDHVDDCGDMSDESPSICAHDYNSALQPNLYSCDNKFKCSREEKCINMSLVCNKISDCSDGSDEDGACALACSSNNNPCSHICQKTPSGPMCMCREGYKLRGDGHTCADVAECTSDPPTCSQLCKELEGSFVCSCYDGFMLRSDRRSCKAMGEPMSIIFASQGSIFRLSQKHNTLELVYSQKSEIITGIDVSVADNYVYFSTEANGTLHRLHLVKNLHEYMGKMGRPQKLAVDWLSQNIYYFDNSALHKGIHICNFDRKYCKKIIIMDMFSTVNAIAVDPVNQYLFYAKSNWQMFQSHGSILYKSHLDGSMVTPLYESTNDYIKGVTYNLYKELVYYTDATSGQVYRSHYDGSQSARIIGNLSNPTTLTLFNDHLYFYVRNGYMDMCPLFKDYQFCTSYKFQGRFNELFVLFQSSRQPMLNNICQKNCTHLCVPKNTSFECLCNDNGLLIEKECRSSEVANMAYTIVLRSAEELQNGGTSPVVVFIIVAVMIILVLLGVYYFYSQRRPGSFSISMRFQNPIYGLLHGNREEIILQPGQHEYFNPMNICNEGKQASVSGDRKLVF